MTLLIPGLVILAVVITGAWLACGTDTGVWVLNRYARARGGQWRQHRFWCPGCSKRRHIARTGPIGMTSCIHCTPAPGGTR